MEYKDAKLQPLGECPKVKGEGLPKNLGGLFSFTLLGTGTYARSRKPNLIFSVTGEDYNSPRRIVPQSVWASAAEVAGYTNWDEIPETVTASVSAGFVDYLLKD